MPDTEIVKFLVENEALKEYCHRIRSLIREIDDTPAKNWFIRYYPKKKYTSFVNEIFESTVSRHFLTYIPRDYPREFKYGGGREKSVLLCASRCVKLRIYEIANQIKADHRKKLLNFTKCLSDRLVQDSPVFRDNPIDKEVVSKIVSYCVVSLE